ncbi:MAG: hypothetical protein ACOX66_06855 [Oscillospiraceae bacterium]|jgi:hypothetical protein
MRSIVCNGVRYNSMLKFAEAMGISYNVVYKQLRMGMSPEDIVAARDLSLIAKTSEDEVPTVYKTACEYNGKRYKNLVEASEDLGLKLSQIYAAKNHHHFTASETINYLMRKKNGYTLPRKTRGKSSSNAEEKAAKSPAFFHDGHSDGRAPQFHTIKPIFSLSKAASWNSFKLEENASLWQKACINFFMQDKRMKAAEKANFYKIDEFPVLHFNMSVGGSERPPECWVVLNEAHVEMYITGLFLRAFTQSLGTPYEILNKLNEEYGVRIWMPNLQAGSRELCMGSSLIRDENEISPSLAGRTLFNLIGTCEEIVQMYD